MDPPTVPLHLAALQVPAGAQGPQVKTAQARSVTTKSGEKEVFLDIRSGPPSPSYGSPKRDVATGAPSTDFSAKLPEVLACCSALSFHFALGLVLAYSAVLIPQLEAPDSDLKITKDQASLVGELALVLSGQPARPASAARGARPDAPVSAASVVALSVPVGSLATAPIMEALGRLRTVQLATLPGPARAAGLPYLRGALHGTFVTYVVGAYMPWRTLSWAFTAAPVATVLLMLLWTPESPLWLASKGRKDQAVRSMHFLARRDPAKLASAEVDVDKLVRGAEERRAAQRSGVVAYLATLFSQRTGLRPLLIIAVLFALQQFAGIYVTLFFAVSFFKATFMMRRFGRRPLLMLSAALCCASMAVSGYFARIITTSGDWQPLPGNETTPAGDVVELGAEVPAWMRWVPVVAILVYVYSGMLGLLTIPWTMTAELFAPRVRSLGQGMSVALANVFMFGAVQSYKDLVTLLGGVWAVHWFYAAVSLAAVLFTYLFVPETHRRTLAEIEEYFDTSLLYPAYQRRRRRQQRDELVVNRADDVHSNGVNGNEALLGK
ncbi:hypothetical protein FOCC_FOCC002229 [Frankliniella occidentalis]|nr:hypothetical protein FOCC_FOCC002229 [Frankliniella occidentalis]